MSSNTVVLSIVDTLKFFGITALELKSIKTIDLVNDTRLLKTGDVFCAVIGAELDGRNYIEQAIEQGASLIISECLNRKEHGSISIQKTAHNSVQIVSFFELNLALFSFAQQYYQKPQDRLKVIGITGTNGKTSTSQIVAKLLESCQSSCAVIGTTGAGKLDDLIPLENTTPSATLLHQLLHSFIERDISHVAMEVSSHALDQKRITADLVDIAIFTNLSRDHLDYHQSMNNYAKAKLALFQDNDKQVAIINGDDSYVRNWLKQGIFNNQTIVYGRSFDIRNYPHFVAASKLKLHDAGASFKLVTHLGEVDIESKLIGEFNIDNLLASIAVLLSQGMSLSAISVAVKTITPIIGRMESFSGDDMPTTIVDYAHTPDALINALKACREHCQGEVWVVFGCGGDRDKGKRSLMGKAAENNADHIIITNDNPRSEAPESIVADILKGCQKPEKPNVILDRAKAVVSTIQEAKAQDIILMAGKGHEDYVIVGNEKIPYNERALVQQQYSNGAIS